MKTSLKLLLPVLLLLTLPAAVQAQFTYTTNNGTITITHYTGTGGAVTIPDTTNGWPVTAIGEFAFARCTTVTSVVVGDNVSGIGYEAFYYCGLTNVTMGNGVTDIGAFTFLYCGALTAVTMGTNVTSLGENAFGYCSNLTSISIPNSVTNIANDAFGVCYGLTSIAIPNGTISSYAFDGCSGLTNVTLGRGVTNVGPWAFDLCTSLAAFSVDPLNPVYTSVDGVLFDWNRRTLVEYPGGKGGDYTVPSDTTGIGQGAFDTCTNLTSVTVPNGVTNIPYFAFIDCFGLTNVTLGNGVRTIGQSAFEWCIALTTVTIGSSITNIGQTAFYGCSSLNGLYFNGNVPYLSGSTWFFGDTNATAYYLPGTTGWAQFSTNTGLPTVLWNPTIQTTNADFGVQNNQFGFTITGTTNIPIAVVACTNMANPTWVPLQTCTLTNGSVYFSDPQWTNYPACLYRIRSP